MGLEKMHPVNIMVASGGMNLLLTAHLALVVNSCAMKRCIINCHVVEDLWFYKVVFGPNT